MKSGDVAPCTVIDCGRRVHARGYCSSHYAKLVRRAARRPRPTLEERFWAKVDKGVGCWVWIGAKTAEGYGAFKAHGHTVRAHRFAFESIVGPIPAGLVLDHLCRNRACVRPGHLEPVTHGENTRRGTGPSAGRARQTECIYGHAFDERNTYWRPDGRGRECLACRRSAA